MSTDSLIIDARRQLPWTMRLASDTSTAMLWGWWLWLCRPVLGMVSWISAYLPSKLLIIGSTMTLEAPMAALVGTSGSLMLWNLLPAQSAPTSKAYTLNTYANHFNLPMEQITDGREASVCVVHHGDDGRIVRIERQA